MPINLTDGDALERLEAKLKKLTSCQDMMKEINAVIRDRKKTDEQKTGIICERYQLKPETVEKLLHPKESWHTPGFESWQLTNQSAEIRRIKKRIEEVVRYQREFKATENAAAVSEIAFDGGNIVDNVAENRIQIFFDDKPEEELRSKLKMYGFKWAPSIGCWQRFRNTFSFDRTKRMLNIEVAP